MSEDTVTARARRGERAQDRQGRGRKRRTPMGAPQLKLDAPTRPGFNRRWFNDTPGRIDKALQHDWTHVMQETKADGEPQPVKALVGRTPEGQPLHAYLMEIPEEYYAEDQAAKQEAVDAVDQAIRRGQHLAAGGQAESQAFYNAGTNVKDQHG